MAVARPKAKKPKKAPTVELVMLQDVIFGTTCRTHKFTRRPGWQTCAHCPVKGFFRRLQP